MATDLPVIPCRGVLFLTDVHLAGTPPGQRLPGYMEQTLAKLAFCLEEARRRDLLPVICGDLFHWPRENPNELLVRCLEIFRPLAGTPLEAWVLVGNHDKWQARYTDDVSLAVLETARICKVMHTPGPQCRLEIDGRRVLLGASPDMTALPRHYPREEGETVIWVTHHGLGFRDYLEKHTPMREIPGVDWVFNGHLHQPQPMERRGATRYVNLGSLARMTFSPRTKARRPAAWIWRPDMESQDQMERLEVPFLPFEQVFPDQPFPQAQEKEPEGGSRFVAGLERLAWRRTREGAGVKQFLDENLDPSLPESSIIMQLYEEVCHGRGPQES